MKKIIYLTTILLAVSCSKDDGDGCSCEDIFLQKAQTVVSIKPCLVDEAIVESMERDGSAEQGFIMSERHGCTKQ